MWTTVGPRPLGGSDKQTDQGVTTHKAGWLLAAFPTVAGSLYDNWKVVGRSPGVFQANQDLLPPYLPQSISPALPPSLISRHL